MRCIDDFLPVADLVQWMLLGDIEVSEPLLALEDIFSQHNKLVVVANHGPLLGAIACLASFPHLFNKHGGGKRNPLVIAWRGFYQIPPLKPMLSYISQLPQALSFEQILQRMLDEEVNDCLILPEGHNCNFGNGKDIQPFVSPRFIELSIEADVPVLVVVHQGSEEWASLKKLSSFMLSLATLLPRDLEKRLQSSEMLSIPRWPKRLGSLKTNLSAIPPDNLQGTA